MLGTQILLLSYLSTPHITFSAIFGNLKKNNALERVCQGIRSSRSILAMQSLKITLATGDHRSLIKTDLKKLDTVGIFQWFFNT